MTEKELKKLSRKQLLELLLKQTERVDRLQKQLEEAQKSIEDKTLKETEAGSIAEAALKLNGVFEAAEAAAAQYLENIKRISEDKDSLNEQMQEQCRKKTEEMIKETEERCRRREKEAEEKLKEISEKLSQMYKQKQTLDELFKDYSVK